MDGIETIAKGDGSRIVEPQRLIARERAAFSAIWAAHAGPEGPEPVVNFDTRMVAAVFAGERPTPGFEVAVTGTRVDGAALHVLVAEQSPDPAMVSAQIIVSPFHIVSLPKHEGEIRFSTADLGEPQTTQPQTTQTTQTTQPQTTQNAHATQNLSSIRWQESGASSTGLTPQMAATLAYLAGPFSGALVLAVERTSGFVRFHAWQAVFGLGVLGTAAVLFMVLAFVLLIASPTAFWAMLWLAAITWATWVVVWAMCLVHAYKGRVWKLPFAGDYADRYTNS